MAPRTVTPSPSTQTPREGKPRGPAERRPSPHYRPGVAPGGPRGAPTPSPLPGHRRAPFPTPGLGAEPPRSVPSGLGVRLGPRARGPARPPRRRPPASAVGPATPSRARRAAHRVGLQALARLDGCCQRHRVVQQHLAGWWLLHKGHPGPPGRRRRHLTTRGRNRRRRVPPPAALRRRCCQHAPPHALPRPRGPSADAPTPPCASTVAAASRAVLAPTSSLFGVASWGLCATWCGTAGSRCTPQLLLAGQGYCTCSSPPAPLTCTAKLVPLTPDLRPGNTKLLSHHHQGFPKTEDTAF
jgi:hypothetical protein